MKIIIVVGTRPNLIKAAPLHHAIVAWNAAHPTRRIEHSLAHTGQHYDSAMSEQFFAEFGLPEPAWSLGVGSGTHAEQVGRSMVALERVLDSERPDWTIVVGDVNATVAAALAAKKLQLKVAHVEAGLRSHDWAMPEEINRIVADRLSDLLLTTGETATSNLLAEGTERRRIVAVGNVMIDSLERFRDIAARIEPEAACGAKLLTSSTMPSLVPRNFALATLHRPHNVDALARLGELATALESLSRELPIVMPVHPRTRSRLLEFNLWEKLASARSIILTEPLTYTELLALTLRARVVLTDSGGIQEEACVLGTPCLTLRPSTERPETLRENGGTSELVSGGGAELRAAWTRALAARREPFRPALWDGAAAHRIVEALVARNADSPIGIAEPGVAR